MSRLFYRGNEFCEKIGCDQYSGDSPKCTEELCPHSAKEFHKWLKSNGFDISKKCTHQGITGNYIYCPQCGELIR
jgi:hypothetical protein